MKPRRFFCIRIQFVATIFVSFKRRIEYTEILQNNVPDFLRGDPSNVNLDGSVNLLDASAFISAITGGDYVPEADINLDGVNDLQDVAGFVDLLIS